MGEQVKVADIETIERFRAQLIQAAETFGLALEEAEGEIERTVAWLESDRPDTWRKQIRKAQDKVVECKGALYRKQEIKATPEARPSVVDERKALERAQRRLEFCEEKLRNTKRWSTELPRQAVVFKGALTGMHVMLDRDVPRINAMLKRMTEHLEEYLRGGEEPERLLEILGTAACMRRAGEDEEQSDSLAKPDTAPDATDPTSADRAPTEEQP